MARTIRLAYLVTHPIQYQTPLLRRIAQEPHIDLTVFYCSDLSLKAFKDPGFNQVITWDVPLLEGYSYEFLPAIGRTDQRSFWRPFNYGLSSRLKAGNFEVLWIHGYARWYHWLAMRNAKRLGIKVMIRDEATLISAQRSGMKKALKQLFFKQLKATCDAFLAIGTLNREYYRHYQMDEDQIFLMPYAVDNTFFQTQAKAALTEQDGLRSSLELAPERPIILYVGKMSARKRAVDLLEAYIRLSPDGHAEPHPYLLFIGDGETRPLLEQRILELGWNSIKLLGFKNQTELPRYYALCDVFVLPADHEPWGLVINEAMNAGCAVIASDQVGCGPDLVKEGKNGYTFKAGDIEALHQVLRKVTITPENYRAMGQRSLAIINTWNFEEDLIGLKQALEYILSNREEGSG